VSTSRRGRFAIGASIVSFVFVATVAATPGSPFSPALPAAARPSGPFRWLSGVVGVDAVHGTALSAVGVAAVALAAAAFAFVLYETWRGEIPSRTVLWLTVAYHVALLFIPLLFSRDVYSYAYYGRIAAVYHSNPYVATPADYPRDALAAFVGPKWFDTPAVYGPLWTQASALVARAVDEVAQFIAVFRGIAIAASLATIAFVARLVRRERPHREAFAVAILGLNPVVLFQSVASGHNDLLVALSIASALALVYARRNLLATAVLALGTLVKVTAVVPLLLLVLAAVARAPARDRWRVLAAHGGVALGIALLAAAPFLNTTDPTLGVFELATHEGWLAPSRLFHRLFDAVGGEPLELIPRIVFPLVFVAAIVAIGRRLVDGVMETAGVGAAWGWGLLCLTLLGPVLLPWYVTWTLPLAWLLPRVPRIVLIGTSLGLIVSQWTSEPAMFASAYDANLLFGHYVLTPILIALLVWLLVDLWARVRSGAPLEDAPYEVPAPTGKH
jgi:alpha-1,6-mannosyltransferase